MNFALDIIVEFFRESTTAFCDATVIKEIVVSRITFSGVVYYNPPARLEVELNFNEFYLNFHCKNGRLLKFQQRQEQANVVTIRAKVFEVDEIFMLIRVKFEEHRTSEKSILLKEWGVTKLHKGSGDRSSGYNTRNLR